VLEALGIEQGGHPAVDDDPDIKPGALIPDSAVTLVSPTEEILEGVEESPESWLGTPTDAALDPKARLIPHALDAVVGEYYRKLRTKILQQQAEKSFQSLVITSAGPQEGKTVTVLNLGLSFATLPSFKVLVVDGDQRKGTLGSWLGVDSQTPGLSNIIDGSRQLDEVTLHAEGIPMDFIVRGNSQNTDLDATHLRGQFQRLSELYDLVLVDSAPVNLLADVQLLAAACDAVLLVARAFSTTQKAFEKAVHDLSRFRIIGTVLNGGSAQAYQYRGKYY